MANARAMTLWDGTTGACNWSTGGVAFGIGETTSTSACDCMPFYYSAPCVSLQRAILKEQRHYQHKNNHVIYDDAQLRLSGA